MAYDPEMDRVLASWINEETGLMISINRYGDGEPKVQIGPRTYTKRDGSRSSAKPGRLTMDDILWLGDVIEEVKEKMKDLLLDE
jgi:hypothetical protein